jgi:hypothetical protein
MLFRIFDKNNTGTFNFERFLIAMWNVASFDEDDLASFSFQVFDTDHSGLLSMDEINDIINIAWGGDAKTNQRVLFALKRLDSNKDGEVNLKEFVTHVKDFPILLFPVFEMQGAQHIIAHSYPLIVRNWELWGPYLLLIELYQNSTSTVFLSNSDSSPHLLDN